MTQKALSVEEVLWLKPGEGIATRGRIPADADFFKDHFPGFPVLPGVLALEMLKQSAECYLRKAEASGTKRYTLKKISQIKFVNYLKPGDEWESHLELMAARPHESSWKGKLIHKGQAAVTACLELEEIRMPQTAVKE